MVAVDWWRELATALGVPGVAVLATEAPGLHPTRAATLTGPDEVPLGLVGEIDPAVLEAHGIPGRVAVLEVDLGPLLAIPHGDTQYRRVSRYPSSDLDLAFVAPDEVAAATVAGAIEGVAADMLARLELFDVYRGPGVGEGRRSLAYRLRLQAPDRTLTDADVAAVRTACITAAAAVGAVLRA
jgi:phenylalanyl-tRNA synthetase beta chain